MRNHSDGSGEAETQAEAKTHPLAEEKVPDLTRERGTDEGYSAVMSPVFSSGSWRPAMRERDTYVSKMSPILNVVTVPNSLMHTVATGEHRSAA